MTGAKILLLIYVFLYIIYKYLARDERGKVHETDPGKVRKMNESIF